MPTVRTPLTGQISMDDIGNTLVPSWTPTTITMNDVAHNDFGDTPPGLAYCYGAGATAVDLNSYHDMLGWVSYTARATNVNNVNTIAVDINPMNGSNGTPPGTLVLDTGNGQLPSGNDARDGAHWATLQFVVTVGGMSSGSFDVYFDGTYIDTIFNDGIYVYDNGGVGYTNGYGTADRVYIDFQ